MTVVVLNARVTRRDGQPALRATSSISPRNCLFSLTLFITLAVTATVTAAGRTRGETKSGYSSGTYGDKPIQRIYKKVISFVYNLIIYKAFL